MKNAKRWNSETSYSVINARTVNKAKPVTLRNPEPVYTADPWEDSSFIAGLHEWCDVEASLDLMFPDTRMPRP